MNYVFHFLSFNVSLEFYASTFNSHSTLLHNTCTNLTCLAHALGLLLS